MSMEFALVHKDTQCDCITGLNEDISGTYARKITNPTIRGEDLTTYWDNGKRVKNDDCKTVCGYKGASINVWSEESRESVINKYLTTFRNSPGGDDSIFIFKFREGAGLVKPTPTKKDDYHYTFYKCDDFELNMLEEIQVIQLKTLLDDDEAV